MKLSGTMLIGLAAVTALSSCNFWRSPETWVLCTTFSKKYSFRMHSKDRLCALRVVELCRDHPDTLFEQCGNNLSCVQSLPPIHPVEPCGP